PSLLSEELATNPFLRYDNADVVSAAMKRTEQSSLNADEVFGAIRQWKDTF
ncbi:MAG: hydroxyacylglutathione hydrolase C-terminal domain-containing protein, partial [Pseudomonadales bacterium]